MNFKTEVTGIILSLNGSELMIRVLATVIKDGSKEAETYLAAL